MKNLSTRLKFFITSHTEYPSIRKFEVAIGWNNNTVNQMTDNPKVERLEDLEAFLPHLNIEWLKTGEGSMLKPDKKADALQQLNRAKKKSNGVHEANRDEGIEIDIENVHSVRAIVIPVKGQAGLQAHYFDEVLFKDLDTEELLTTEKHLGKYFKIEVQGESMDDGTSKGLQPGDWAYCRSVPKQYWREKLYTHKWRIWCFFHNERGIIFKSIVSHDVDTGEMVLESLNPNKALYPNFRINIGECSYVCNVVKKLSPL